MFPKERFKEGQVAPPGRSVKEDCAVCADIAQIAAPFAPPELGGTESFKVLAVQVTRFGSDPLAASRSSP